MSVINIDHVEKRFGNSLIIKEFTAEFKDGEFVTLLGPSGCGKTTMLRMIAGFERPTKGSIRIGGETVSSEDTFVPPEKRGIGMVFQSYAVWPHMNVFDNIAYPLKIQKKSREEIRQRVEHILDMVHLTKYRDRMPSHLSGGQQQRIALGRALAAETKVLLLDEPLSNLDAKLREEMRFEIKEIQKKLNATVVYVTHDQSEAMTMSDRVFVLNGGIVQQVGSPVEIYRRPANAFVADFVGRINLLKGTAGNGRIEPDGLEDPLTYDGELSGRVDVLIRPENIRITKTDSPDMQEGAKKGRIRGIIKEIFYMGDTCDYRVMAGGHELRADAGSESYGSLSRGDEVILDITDYMVFEENTDAGAV